MSVLAKAVAVLMIGSSAAATIAVQQPAGEAQPAAPVTPEEARRTALALADVLEENYVSPDIAARYAAALRAKAEAGGYDRLSDPRELARALTADVQAVSPDNHLRVGPRGAGGPPMVRRAPGTRAPGAGNTVEEARWLAPGVAYIRYTMFSGDPEAVAATSRFFAEHADAGTLIVDIRTHRGGGLAEMDAMFPYLFPEETVLVQMDTRASVDGGGGSPIGREPSLRQVAAPAGVVRREHFVRPHPSEKRLFDAKVFLLTSNFSASAAEHFALSLKRTGRATLIGEKTAGAGNYGGMRPIGDRFAAFVPVGLTRDPKTGARWEGDGIEPDIQVPAEQALVEALVRSGVSKEQAETLSAAVHPKGSMRRQTPLSG